MSNQPSVKKNFIYNTAYQILVLIIPLVTTPYISRVLGVENVGIYSYTQSLVAYFSLFSLLGIHNYATREIAYCNDQTSRNKVFNSVQTTKLFTCTSILLLYVIFSIFQTEYTIILLILGITLIANYFDISWFFQGQQNFKIIVLRNLIVKLIGVGSIFLFVKDRNDLYIYVLINVLSTLVGNISLWFVYFRSNKLALVLPSKYLAKTTVELFIPLIAIQVYNVLDKTMIGNLTNDMVESGCYEQTTKIITLCLTLVTSLTTVLSPKMASFFANNNIQGIKDTVQKTYHIVMMLSFPVCFGIIGISNSFVPWFFGTGYEKVKLLLKIYSLVILIIPLSNVAGTVILTPTKQHNKGTIAVTTGAITNFILNYLLIARYGAVGAAVSTIIAESVVTIIHFYYIKSYVIFNDMLKENMKFMASSLIMLIFIVALDHTMRVFNVSGIFITMSQIFIGAIVYGIIVLFIIKDEYLCGFFKQIYTKVGGENV